MSKGKEAECNTSRHTHAHARARTDFCTCRKSAREREGWTGSSVCICRKERVEGREGGREGGRDGRRGERNLRGLII